ncbi:BTB/POZ domain [Nesidiocoris tenuis]|uniref:BTB/POZ domain n=1 Tax=Nesidiocoris tenuis TaxID=355587 RepID=A0ABN7BFF8_9HEMI|nr:BTB/POZ domain [Nesidiocoris tenuis]
MIRFVTVAEDLDQKTVYYNHLSTEFASFRRVLQLKRQKVERRFRVSFLFRGTRRHLDVRGKYTVLSRARQQKRRNEVPPAWKDPETKDSAKPGSASSLDNASRRSQDTVSQGSRDPQGCKSRETSSQKSRDTSSQKSRDSWRRSRDSTTCTLPLVGSKVCTDPDPTASRETNQRIRNTPVRLSRTKVIPRRPEVPRRRNISVRSVDPSSRSSSQSDHDSVSNVCELPTRRSCDSLMTPYQQSSTLRVEELSSLKHGIDGRHPTISLSSETLKNSDTLPLSGTWRRRPATMGCNDDCTCHLCRELGLRDVRILGASRTLGPGDTKITVTDFSAYRQTISSVDATRRSSPAGPQPAPRRFRSSSLDSNFILCQKDGAYKSIVQVPGPPSPHPRPGGVGNSGSREIPSSYGGGSLNNSGSVTPANGSPGSGTGSSYSLAPSSTVPHHLKPASPSSSSESQPSQPPTPIRLGNCSSSCLTTKDDTTDGTTRPPQSAPRSKTSALLPHHHSSQLRILQRQAADSNGSSSDDARTSGHASMSDGHLSSSPTTDRHHHYRPPLGCVPEDDRLSAGVLPGQGRATRKTAQSRSRHRATPAKLVPCGSGIEDIKLAIQQLTMRSHTSNSTSTYSSLSGSEGSEPAVRRLVRHSSLETINTNVTSADEFVWVDSHNRLVELQRLPWSNHDVLKVLQSGRTRCSMEWVAMETVPRLSYLLQRALVRIGREAQRLSKPLAMCGKHEVASALKIILSPVLADSCIKACLRSGAMFAVSGDQLKQSKSQRAGLHLSVGRFHRWMVDVRIGKFVHEYAAVYLAAGLENLLEEIILQCLPSKPDSILTASMFEHAIANNSDLWGLLQPYAHLNTGRTASGTLALPRWASVSSVSTDTTCGSGSSKRDHSLLTTCVASASELAELLRSSTTVLGARPHFSPAAIQSLFYFMRCSQLEHCGSVQELVYERAYVVLPPLLEWVRCASAHAAYRHSSVVDSDDVMQAARLLLPGVDCPVRQPGPDESLGRRSGTGDEVETVRRLKTAVAFRMLSSAVREMVPHALQLLPSATKLDTVCDNGLSPLMLACVNNDESVVRILLEFGSDPDLETPPQGSQGCAMVQAENQHWTALTYAALQGHLPIAKLLLERGAHVEGGARLSEEKATMTPLQVAAASGNLEMVSLLLAHGAHPFLSTMYKDAVSYSGAAQRGCYSAFAVAAAHGQRAVLHKLLSHPLNPNTKEVLSLEEILAEGADTADRRVGPGTRTANDPGNQLVKLSKAQIKCLQEAMYHSTENNHLEITLDLRNLGVCWSLHCWMSTLATAHATYEPTIDALLQDFLHVWPDDCSAQFVDECLPLLFNIFRYSKNEGTTLLLADIFSTCYGREPIKPIRDPCLNGAVSRIDPKFVNNPELSDVQFRVEGRVFYAHKIVLVTSSPRFRGMLSSKLCEGNPPIVQINDIRYHIFQLVMEFLYKGGCESLDVDQVDVLELMAAANFFQLDGLLHFCEAKCSKAIDLDNIVSMYIHAKVYNAARLMEYCQGFLLQNMVALLTYDDSVRRLLFGKKPARGGDVLTGLLHALQSRIEARGRGGGPGAGAASATPI